MRVLIILLLMVIITGCSTTYQLNLEKRKESSPQYKDGKFANPKEFNSELNFSDAFNGLRGIYFVEQPGSIPKKPLPVKQFSFDQFVTENRDDFHFTKLGHSSILFQMEGKVWLTDPVFSDFITPFEWMGWKRFHSVPVDQDQLMVEGVIISHDHYDHLDEDLIVAIKDRVNYFIVPLGVDERLIDWGVPKEKIRSLDWWESTTIGSVQFISTPSQHFSGRSLFDSGETLWCSWVIKSEDRSLYFSGDSGYFDGFKTIGDKYGPFDITFMECGQYNERFHYIHMMPQESMRAHLDLKGRKYVPIHNSTFKISFHPWFEPLERISALGECENIEVLTPMIGEIVDINSDKKVDDSWWREIARDEKKMMEKEDDK